MPGRHRDQHLRENVPASQKIPVPPPAHTGGTGEDDEDQGLPPLRPLHEQVPVWSEYAGAAAEKPEGLRGDPCGEGDFAGKFLRIGNR